jgi:hypothetical protein
MLLMMLNAIYKISGWISDQWFFFVHTAWGCNFSRVRPFYEQAVSDLDP